MEAHTYIHLKRRPFFDLPYLLGLNHVVKFGLCAVSHSVCVLVCWSDQNSCPNPEAETHLDHTIALIQTQHSACASPEGKWKQTEEKKGWQEDGG